MAGHYHFNSEEYQEIINRLSEKMNIDELILENIMCIIHHYVSVLNGEKNENN